MANRKRRPNSLNTSCRFPKGRRDGDGDGDSKQIWLRCLPVHPFPLCLATIKAGCQTLLKHQAPALPSFKHLQSQNALHKLNKSHKRVGPSSPARMYAHKLRKLRWLLIIMRRSRGPPTMTSLAKRKELRRRWRRASWINS